MCWCNPSIRTPNCGGIACYPPEGTVVHDLRQRIPPHAKSVLEEVQEATKDMINYPGGDVAIATQMYIRVRDALTALNHLLGRGSDV